jgi:hypothetical protein
MDRWKILHQKDGITDVMRANILSTINTAIDTYGSSAQMNIAKDVRLWLETTYRKKWCVIITDVDSSQYSCTCYDSKCLIVKETNLKWNIHIFQQIP